MDDRAVEDAIRLLDSEVPREGAQVVFSQYGGGPDESKIVANQSGYLRLGVEFLKAASAPTGAGGDPNSIDLDLEYLVSDASSVSFDWFERRDLPLEADEYEPSRIVPILIFLGMVGGAVLALIGLISVVQWLAA